MTLEELQNKYLGKSVEFHSYGSGSYAQCVDWINIYINQVLDNKTKDYTEIIGTNAKDFNTKFDADDFEWIANTPTGVPQAGDIIVWNGRVGGGAGHVAIFLEGDVSSFKSLDQNWSRKEYVTLENHNYANVSGWLRPKNVQQMTTISQAELDSIRSARDQHYNDLQEEKKKVEKLTQDLKTSEERIGNLLTELERINNEDKSTSEQLLTAQHALKVFEDEQKAIREELGIEAFESIVESIKKLKEGKNTQKPIKDLTFIERLKLLFS